MSSPTHWSELDAGGTGQMSAVETGLMSAAETGQMFVAGTGEMSAFNTYVEYRDCAEPCLLVEICLVPTADMCSVSAADIISEGANLTTACT